jgi:hypothetical protein
VASQDSPRARIYTRLDTTNPEDLFVINALIHDGIFRLSDVNYDPRQRTVVLHLFIPEGEHVAAHEIDKFPTTFTIRAAKGLHIADDIGADFYDISVVAFEATGKKGLLKITSTLPVHISVEVERFSVEVHRVEES